jgi:acetylornithine/N-succinyldiaminopimelate aminotransferase
MTAFIEAASPHVMNTYGRVPIALSAARAAACGT